MAKLKGNKFEIVKKTVTYAMYQLSSDTPPPHEKKSVLLLKEKKIVGRYKDLKFDKKLKVDTCSSYNVI